MGESVMAALLGYVVALSILLGGGYAGLQWLATPDHRPAAKTVAQNKNAPEKSAVTTGTAAGPSEADAKRNPGTPAKTANAERSDKPAEPADKPARETKETAAKVADVKPDAKDPRIEKAETVPTGGCKPIGLTSNGDLVFSMQCQDLIERHRAEAAASAPTAQTTSGLANDQPAQTAKPAESAKASQTASEAENSNPAQPVRSDIASPDARDVAAKRQPRPSPPKPQRAELARSEPDDANKPQARPSDHNRAGKARNNPNKTAETTRTADTRPNNPVAAPELTERTPVAPKRLPRARPAEIAPRTVEQPAPSREERPTPPARTPRLAARAETEWYNVLGLR